MDGRLRNRLVLAAAIGVLLAFAFLLWRRGPETEPQQAAAPAEPPAPAQERAAPALPAAVPPAKPGVAQSLQPRNSFDFAGELARALREAERGSAAAQYRASVLLRSCPNAASAIATPNELRTRGLDEDHVALIEERKQRCRDLLDSGAGEALDMSRRLKELAFEQGFQVAEAEALVMSPQPQASADIDRALVAALGAAGNDRVLRYETFFLVLGAMDKRSDSSGIEADEMVRNAWTLLHCRESWECGLDATIAHLSVEMPAASLQLTLDLAAEIDRQLGAGHYSRVRLH